MKPESAEETHFYNKFDTQIDRYLSDIESNLETLKPERDFIYKKI